jgi:hypothetical protein
MSIKGAFKKVWQGIKVAEPFLGTAGLLLSATPVGPILVALDALINRAEVLFPASGTGVQKGEFVTLQGLAVAEIVTGKNINNPKTRQLVADGVSVAADIKNLRTLIQQKEAEYAQFAKDLQDAIDSIKDPAIADDAPAPQE